MFSLKNKIRRVCAALAVSVISSCAVPAAAQEKPLTIMTLSGTGSQSDTSARYFAPLLEAELKRPVIVGNYPGGQGLIGIRKFYETQADCSNVLIGHSSIPYVSKFLPQLDMNPLVDLEPLHGLARSASMVIVSANSSIYNISDLAKLSRTNKRVTGASTVVMTAMSMTLFDAAVGTRTEVVSYRNSTQSALDVASGLVDYTFGISGNAAFQGLIDSKKLRVIGVLGDVRSPGYPDTKTMREQGYTSVEDYSWNGFFVHSSDSAACKARLTTAIYRVMRSPKGEAYSTLAGSPQRYLVNASVLRSHVINEYRSMPAPAAQ